MWWRGRAATLVVVLGTSLGFAAALPYFRFTTKITDFLPDDSANRGAQIAALLAQSEFARVMVIDLTLGEPRPASNRNGPGGCRKMKYRIGVVAFSDEREAIHGPELQNNVDSEAARAVLGDDTFARAWAEGQAMSLEEAVGYALSV